MARCPTTLSAVPIRVHHLVRVVLGVILLAAAGLKGYHLPTVASAEAHVVSFRWLAIGGLAGFECILGIWLLSGLRPRAAWGVSLATFGGFGAYSLIVALRGLPSCGCFGGVSVSPWATLVLDLTALAALFFVPIPVPQGTTPAESKPGQLDAVASTVAGAPAVGVVPFFACVLMGFSAGLFTSGGWATGLAGEVHVFQPERLIGKRLPLLADIDIGEDLSRGSWTVLFYHYDCQKCQEALADCEKLAAEVKSGSTAWSIALIEIPPYRDFRVLSVSAPHFRHGRLDDGQKWFVSTPAIVTLRNGMVTSSSLSGGIKGHSGQFGARGPQDE
ncbi:MAG: MauE/DoxX family redox-associated membrane protein [Pirellulales bacterium]